ncbi:AFG1/ZapE family ATPase [Coxiella-like endosymbiont]|uniref:AFG1/ZapE family ATPase n=1 Tax=Coxiella-like endosymbiont TaxID=1592897 RepID=UPI0034E21D1B
MDVFYDVKTRLLISAQGDIKSPYPEGPPLRFEFARTQSRLIEMQSRDYLWRITIRRSKV